MTPELQRRLNISEQPFDGSCARNADDLTLKQLRELLIAATEALSPQYPDIHSFRDWHEHDGFIVESKPDTWDSLQAEIETERTLFDSRDGDYAVRNAIYPPSFEWLMRYNVDEEDERDFTSASCDFDLTLAYQNKTSNIVDDLLQLFPSLLVKCDSRAWFNSNNCG